MQGEEAEGKEGGENDYGYQPDYKQNESGAPFGVRQIEAELYAAPEESEERNREHYKNQDCRPSVAEKGNQSRPVLS